MKVKLFQVDAFTDTLFCGNPAAVCILEEELDERVMQNIAAENNLSETAFVVRNEDRYQIRWFTPVTEVELCGHATLAAAHVLYVYFESKDTPITFVSLQSDILKVTREGEFLILDFPVDTIDKVVPPKRLLQGLGVMPLETYMGKTDYLVVYPSQNEIIDLQPDFRILSELDARGFIVTAPGDEVDFVSRFFAPGTGVNEDPVTGSAHTTLIPYWSNKLQKKKQIRNKKDFILKEGSFRRFQQLQGL